MPKAMKEKNQRNNFCLWRWDYVSWTKVRMGKKGMNKKIDSKTNKQTENKWMTMEQEKINEDSKEETMAETWPRVFLCRAAYRRHWDAALIARSSSFLIMPFLFCLLRLNFPAPWFRQTSFDCYISGWTHTHTETSKQTDRQKGAGAERKKTLDFKCYVIALSFSIITLLNTKAQQL